MSTFRIQYGAPEPVAPTGDEAPPPIGQTIRIGGQTIVAHSGGHSEQRGTTSVNMFNESNGATGILATARSSDGIPCVVADLKPNDRVTFAGMEMTVESAERVGLIQRNAQGRYEEAPQQAQPAQQEPEAIPGENEALANGAEETLTQVCAGIMPMEQLRMVTELTESGTISEKALSAAASQMGIEPSDLRSRIDGIEKAFTAQAEATARRLGVSDAADMWEWAAENCRKDLQAAMHKHAIERSTAGYEPVIRAYIDALPDRDPEAILNAEFGSGVSAQKIDGKIVLTIGGVQMAWESALRHGLITVRPK